MIHGQYGVPLESRDFSLSPVLGAFRDSQDTGHAGHVTCSGFHHQGPLVYPISWLGV